MSEINLQVSAGDVISTAVDNTLSVSGEAADAAAVGAALALKADRTEIAAAVTVNGQSADEQGHILINAGDIPLSGTDDTTIAEQFTTLSGKTGADIAISGDSSTTIKETIEDVADDVSTALTNASTALNTANTAQGDINNLRTKVLPSGGSSGNVLTKSGDGDYAVAWGTMPNNWYFASLYYSASETLAAGSTANYTATATLPEGARDVMCISCDLRYGDSVYLNSGFPEATVTGNTVSFDLSIGNANASAGKIVRARIVYVYRL